MNQAKLPPGPSNNLIFSARKDLRDNILNVLVQNIKDYPGISRMKIGPYYFVHLSEPAYIEHALADSGKYVKGRENAKMKFLLGNGLLTSEGKFWLKQRRLIQPLFHKRRLDGFVQKITALTDEMIKAWQNNSTATRDIHAEMTKLTLGIVSQTLLSADASGEFKEVGDALNVVMKGLWTKTTDLVKLPYWIPTPQNVGMKKNRKILDATILRIIENRRSDKKQYDDLLTMLMEVEDADTAEKMTNVQLRDEVLTIFLAGHETTANALSFAFYLLAQHPEIRARIAEETNRVLSTGPLSAENINQLEYTTRVIKETMRLYPPVWGLIREATQDDVIDNFLIKKGDSIVLAPYAVHRWGKYWTEPSKFDPDRFLPERLKVMHRYTYFPFGGGARFCIGNNFAMMEMQIVLALVCAKFSFLLPQDFILETEALVTLRPKGELRLEVTAAVAPHPF